MHLDSSVTLFAIISFVLVMFPLWLAIGKRSVDGTVSDRNGEPIHRATVRLTNLRNADVLGLATDLHGRFCFEGLSSMTDYEITVELDEWISAPIRIWQYAYHSELHLQLEPRSSQATPTRLPLLVLREGIANPHWWPELF